ncbi:SURF1 family cytochrome oxidase biogenesis protein [Kocuria rhizophila]|uniref:SURF1 family cytochrome oxidase biogenesis protein n=1 Tax=Kocuria rhizophila TaxID=72000 RepID=UPI00073D8EF7|nr:SURF1 family protein [Kocuria rhizophila]WTI33445.1 SURF1 family protein [Kocuria rhizophila]
MRKYSFLTTPAWIGWFLMACAAAVVCLFLAQWQMSRNDHLVAENTKITNNYDAPAYDPARGLPLFQDYDDSATWHPVRLEGTYLPEDTVLIRNRPHDGRVGYDVLVPLRTTEGPVVAVNRGWIPTDDSANGMPSAVPAPPAGTVTVTARLRPSEATVDRGAPEGQAASIDLPALSSRWGEDLATGGYGDLVSEDPSAAHTPQPGERPEVSYGPHLSYSMQWYAFAVLVFVAYGYSARQHVKNEEWDRAYAAEVERQLARYYDAEGTYIGDVDESLVIRQLQMADDMPAHLKSLYRPKRTRVSSVPTAEDEEDALLDALEAQNRR